MAIDISTTVLGVGLPLVAGIICLFILVYILVLCVCFDSEGKNTVTAEKYIPSADSPLQNDSQKAKVDSVAIDVDNSLVPLENGQVVKDDLRLSNTSQRSPGHSPHHANQRQLPAPPQNTGNGALGASVTSGASDHSKESNKEDSEGEDDYDHLNENKKTNRMSNYDHVVLDKDGTVTVKESKNDIDTDYAEVNLDENIYTPVKDGGASKSDYSKGVNINSAGGQGHSTLNFSSVDDPYASVKDDEKEVRTNGIRDEYYAEVKSKDDPYAKVKGDKEDPYTKVKGEKEDPYAKVKGDKEDPYAKVKEKDDPYNRVKEPGEQGSSDESDPYNKVKDEDDDPYNSVSDDEIDQDKIDDPYNKIRTDFDPYNKVNDGVSQAGSKVKDTYSVVKKTSIKVTTKSDHTTVDGASTSEFFVEKSVDEYAVVMKKGADTPTTLSNNGTSNGEVHSPSVDSDQYQLPPEPPRNYLAEGEAEEGVDNGGPWRIPVTVNTGAAAQPPPQNQGDNVVRRKEPPYIKLTSRESMASINARQAQNTYETVVESENMYATVEGGSGDGVVRPLPTAASANAAQSRNSQSNDFYAEIGASGGTQARVPAPPSLDSLHMMTKSHPDARQGSRSSVEESDLRPLSDQMSSPGAFSNQSEAASNGRQSRDVQLMGFNDSKGDNSILLDPDYQTVRDSVGDLDIDCDIDPNYESVEEAKAKASKFELIETQKSSAVNKVKRNHVYEEVKPSSASVSDSNQTSRVMRSHMYEDIDEVQEQKKELNRKSQELDKKTKSTKKK